jgi:cytidyltransferase-like protein
METASESTSLRLGLFGGSFDPVHLGHLEIARSAKELFDLDEVHFILANVSPFKFQDKPKDHENAEAGIRQECKRAEILKLALEDYAGTARKRTSSRLRRTNDRSVPSVHEDHEDDENAEIEVREQCLDVEFYCADILDMQLTEKDFDCVIMNACLEHFDLASAAQLLANLKKHLKPKAYIYGVFDMVATSNKGEFICFDDGTRQYLDPMRKGMYLRNYSDDDLAKLFTEAGFKQLSYTTVDNGSRVVVLEYV